MIDLIVRTGADARRVKDSKRRGSHFIMGNYSLGMYFLLENFSPALLNEFFAKPFEDEGVNGVEGEPVEPAPDALWTEGRCLK